MRWFVLPLYSNRESSIQRLSINIFKYSKVLLKRLYTLYSWYNVINCFDYLGKFDIDVITIETIYKLYITELVFFNKRTNNVTVD